jgi:glycosyltransferase involved in cell wall biosynthesis
MTRSPHPIWDPVALWRLARLLRRSRFDVVHLHSAKAGWLGRIAAWNLDSVVVYSPHAFPFLQRAYAPCVWAYEFAERLAARRTDVLFAVSPDEARIAIARGLARSGTVRVLKNAVDVARLDREFLGSRPVDPVRDFRRFGFAGYLRIQKDPLTFLEACRLVHATGVAASFVLPARGALLGAVRRFVRRHRMESVVELVPPRGSFLSVYREADVCVLPSLWEGLPYSLLEALALRRPVIGSRLPIFEEILGPIDPGLLFSPGDAAGLAERMAALSVASRERIADLGESGRRLVIAEHGIARWAESLREFYRSIGRHESRRRTSQPVSSPHVGARPAKAVVQSPSTSR